MNTTRRFLSATLLPRRTTRPAASSVASLFITLLLYCAFAIPAAVADTGTLYSLSNDAEVNRAATTGSLTIGRLTSTYGQVGGYDHVTTGTQSCVVYMFQIPSALLTDPSQEFSAANFSIHFGSVGNTTVNVDLYGVGYGTSPDVLTSDFYEGALDSNSTLIQDSFLVPTTTPSSTVSTSNAALISYLNAQLRAARAVSASSAYVFFRLNTDAPVSYVRYQVAMNEIGGTGVPTLSYTTVPISDWKSVPLGGGGCVNGFATDPSGSAVYCHMDVGGAYRWQYNQWVSITDRLVSGTSINAAQLGSIAAIAVDPSNPNQLYVAAGFSPSSLHGIYSSSDLGASWTKINSTILMDANGNGKICGNARLAVDPNNSTIVWFGSTQDGLQKGVLSSGTWTWTQIPSASVPFGQVVSGGKYGVSFVACDKNGGSTIVYAGVFDTVGSTGGVYMSTDNGTTWSKVSGVTLSTPVNGQVASNGTLYVNCSTTATGAVAKLLRSGTLQAITPTAGLSYVGLAVALSDTTGNTVFTAQMTSGSQYGKVFRSTDGGATWNTQSSNFNNKVYTRTEPDGTPGVCATWFAATDALLVSATNANELWAADTLGVVRTQNAQNIVTTSTSGAFWYTVQKGEEETCVQDLKCAPSGAPLMVGVADVNGFRYTDTSVRPTGAGGNAFTNPNSGNTTSLDYYESNPNIWVRAWLVSTANNGTGAVSKDNGVTWMPFGMIDTKTVVTGSTAGWESWDVSTYLSTQKAKGSGTTTLVVCAGNSITPLYSNLIINFDSKEGGVTNAPQLLVNGTTTLTAIADSYVSGTFTTTNYGSATNLSISHKGSETPENRWVYLKFDLSGVGAITSATLQLHRQTSSYAQTFPVNVYACTNTSWVESTITWANKPALLASTAGDPIESPQYAYMAGRVAISSTNPNCMVWVTQGTSNAPRYSNDFGVTWNASTGGPTSQIQSRFYPSVLMQPLAADRVNGKFYYMRMGEVPGGHHAIYTSTNSGATWVLTSTCATSSYNVYRAQIVAAPAANDVWISDDGVDDTSKGGVWRSTNGGATWTKLTGVTAARQVAFGKPLSTGYSVFINGYVNGIRGIYRSDNYGASWNMLDVTPTLNDIDALAGDRQTYGRVYIGTNGRGTFQSE